MTETVSTGELVRRLDGLLAEHERAVMAFDADGTLWSGDVGEDVFHAAAERQLLRPASRVAFAETAARYGIDDTGGPNEIARRLLRAWEGGRLPVTVACEMMTWAYAGFTMEELRELAQHVLLEEKHLEARLQPELGEIFDWARARRVRSIVVSASPRPLVEIGAALLDIAPDAIAAADAEVASGVVQDRMAAPLPFGPTKRVLGRTLAGEAVLLASFGDNAYDLHLLRAARVGVAVRPKPSLVSVLPGADGIVVLSPLG